MLTPDTVFNPEACVRPRLVIATRLVKTYFEFQNVLHVDSLYAQ